MEVTPLHLCSVKLFYWIVLDLIISIHRGELSHIQVMCESLGSRIMQSLVYFIYLNIL